MNQGRAQEENDHGYCHEEQGAAKRPLIPYFLLHNSDARCASRGFTLLFAVLVSSLVLAIGIAIATIAIKEQKLSASIRESQFAFYAADSGVECVLYHDIRGFDVFAISEVYVQPPDIQCNGQNVTTQGWSVVADATSATTEFQVNYPPPAEYCAIITVSKTNLGADTRVESRGYNTCIAGDVRRVERGIRITY